MTGLTLFLVVRGTPFDLMASGEKTCEFRRPSAWMRARLLGRHYETVTLQRGYAKNAPRLVCEYRGWCLADCDFQKHYPTLTVKVNRGDYLIQLGKILSLKEHS